MTDTPPPQYEPWDAPASPADSPAASERALRVDAAFPPFESIGAPLRAAADLFFANLAPIAAIAFIVYGPTELLSMFLLHKFDLLKVSGLEATAFNERTLTAMAINTIPDLFAGALAFPAVIHLVITHMQREVGAGVGRSLRYGLRASPYVLLNHVLLLMIFIIGGIGLFVPSIIAIVWLCLIDPVLCVEGEWSPRALWRSVQITKNWRWAILFAGLLGWLITIAATVVISMVLLSRLDWVILAIVQTVSKIAFLYLIVLSLAMYLGIVQPQRSRYNR